MLTKQTTLSTGYWFIPVDSNIHFLNNPGQNSNSQRGRTKKPFISRSTIPAKYLNCRYVWVLGTWERTKVTVTTTLVCKPEHANEVKTNTLQPLKVTKKIVGLKKGCGQKLKFLLNDCIISLCQCVWLGRVSWQVWPKVNSVLARHDHKSNL